MPPESQGNGHWEARSKVVIDPNTGKRRTVTRWVWVPDPKVKKNQQAAKTAADAAAKRAAARAKTAAQKRAAELEAKARAAAQVRHAQEVARKRSVAYSALAAKQKQLMEQNKAAMQRGQQTAQTADTGLPGPAEKRAAAIRTQQYRTQQAAAAAAEAKAKAEAEASARVKEAQRKRLVDRLAGKATQGVGVDPYTGKKRRVTIPGTGVKTAQDAQDAEALIKEQEKLTEKGEGMTPDELKKVSDNYGKYAMSVRDKYVAHVAKINKWLDIANDESLPIKRRMRAYNRAKNYFNGKIFKGDQGEFIRLFGDGDKKVGEVTGFYETADRISMAQRKWIQDQTQAALQSQLRMLHGHGEADSQEAQDIRESLAIWRGNPSALGKVVDHYRVVVGPDGRRRALPVYRDATVQEALDRQQATIIAREQALWQEHQRQMQAQFLRDRHIYKEEGLVHDPVTGQYYDPDELEFQQGVIAVAKQLWGDELPPMKREEDIQHVGDAIVGEWVKRNPAPEMYMKRGGDTYYGAYAYDYSKINPEYKAWEGRKKAYEDKVYLLITEGAHGTPDFLQRLTSVPGISHVLALFQAPVAATGALIRVTLKATSGRSQVELSVPIEKLPEHIQKDAALAMAPSAFQSLGGDSTGIGTHISAGASMSVQVEAQKRYDDWLNSDEGQKWLWDHEEELRKAAEAEDTAFAEGFYGDGSAADKLDALNAYGSRPTTNEWYNMGFNLLFDPLNGIPLNFTTYLSRARYAAGLARDASKLNPVTWGRALRDAVKVDEGVLKLEKELSKYEKLLAETGMTPEQAADALRREIKGITDPTKLKTVTENWMKKVGLDSRKVDAEQIFNLAEWYATKAAKESGNLFDQQATLAKRLERQQAELRKAERKAIADEKAAKSRVAAETDAIVERGRASQERLAIQREADEARLKANADAVAGQQSAAREAVGTSPAPKRPTKPKAPEPPLHEPGQTSARVREAVGHRTVKRAADYPEFKGEHEYYRPDAGGNMIPRDLSYTTPYMKTPEYRALVKRVKAGDEAAKEQLAYVASLMRNAYRTAMEDIHDVRSSRFTPSRYDLLDRAGLLDDADAARILDDNRAAVRELKRSGGRKNADAYVEGFQQSVPTEGGTEIGRVTRGDAVEDLEDFAASGERLDTGLDIIAMRDSSPMGLQNAYGTFTHNMLQSFKGFGDKGLEAFFSNLRKPKWVATKLKPDGFRFFLRELQKGKFGEALVGWRDGGMAMFEIFHQLRLAGNVKQLQEFSVIVDLAIKDNPLDPFLRMWKVMEARAGLPWADAEWAALAKFKEAAVDFGLDPNLASSGIPNGYYARRPAMSFGLSPNLSYIETLDDWLPAPSSWNRSKALRTVTEIFTRNVGEPMQIVHYVAQLFGDFKYGTPIRNRMLDELVFDSTKRLGLDQIVSNLLDHIDDTPLGAKFAERGASRIDQENLLRSVLGRAQAKTPRGSFLRPAYPELREVVEKAYWAGDLPLTSTRAHDLMYLAHMQSTWTRDAMVDQTLAYMKYLRDMGEAEHAQTFLQRIHHIEFQNLHARWRAEKRGPAPKVLDPVTGASLRITDSREWQMWIEMGFNPKTTARVERELKGIRRNAQEIADSARAHVDDLAHERDKPADAYTGVSSDETWSALADRIDDALKKAPSERGPRDIKEISDSLLLAVRRAADNGGALNSADVSRHLEDISGILREHPSGNAILRRLGDELGDGIAVERTLTAPEMLAYREALLRIRLKATLAEDGTVIPKYAGYNARIQRELEDLLTTSGQSATKRAQEKMAAMRAQYEAEAAAAAEAAASPGEIHIEPPTPDPAVAAKRAHAEELLQRLTGMTEEQYYASVRARANRVLRRKTSTRAQRDAARARLRDVDLAEYAMRIDKSRGSHIPWQRRADARAAALAKHGKDAEEFIAPNMIAPYARDAAGAVVEQVRTWRRQLSRAAAENAESRVKALGTGEHAALDHFPIQLFDSVEQEVAAAIRKARGWTADNLTRSRGSKAELRKMMADSADDVNASRMVDRDPIVLAAKKRVLDKYGISMDAYDEARKVLWKGYVQRRTNQWLIDRTDKVIEAAKRMGVKDPSWDKAYLSIRQRLAREEAQRQLGGLAYGEMFGFEPSEVFAAFKDRYSFDGDLRDFHPSYSEFQKRTLEEAIGSRSGGMDMGDFLQSANRPPFEKGREAVREWLKKYGTWSPRRAEEFVLGHSSWSIRAEAEYWDSAFGFVPDWCNPGLLGTRLNDIFHDAELYYRQMTEWGIFNRSNELKLRLDGTSAKAIEDARIRGDSALNLPARRELEAQRRYVVERYGDLVGKIEGDSTRLHAMPWLMYPDEIPEYMARRAANGLPEGLVQTPEELETVVGLIQKHMQPYMEDLLAKTEPILYEDIYRVASKVQAEILADPFWAKRARDITGTTLNLWTKFNRWLIFSNPAFAVMNIIDVPIKTAWYRMSRRGLFNAGLHGHADDVIERARNMTPAHVGLDEETTIYYWRQRKAVEYFTNPRKEIRVGPITFTGPMTRAIDGIEGVAHAVPEAAARAEIAGKMELARGMYPQVYETALKRLKDPELADAFAKRYIKNEISRMWPTAGDGPLEKLFNRLVPFGSYMVRNRVLFISEAMMDPVILNRIEFIGRAIEAQNLENWDKTHPDGEIMPEHLRRRIELPWAPGFFIDLGQFSDATRGLRPLYTAGTEMTNMDRIAQWVRLINPAPQALIYMMTNALGVTQRVQWKPILDENGYPTGKYEKVITGWTEPWSQDQPDLGSAFWFVDAVQSFMEYSDAGWNAGNVSQYVGQLLMFNAIDTYDRGTALMQAYKMMEATDKDAAKAWLANTSAGVYLNTWMNEHAGAPRDFKNFLVDYARSEKTMPWRDWFALTQADRDQITTARSKIKAIRDVYAARLAQLDPSSPEYRELKAEMYYRINEVYLQNPALMKEEVWSKTASEWSQQQADWQIDQQTDQYMKMFGNRPSRAAYDTSAEYNKAVEDYESAKALYLAQYPEVKKRLAGGVLALENVRSQMEADWDATLSRIASRNEEIDAAKQIIEEAGRDSKEGAAAQDRLDILYLQNELDYSTLNTDYVASYFSKNDFDQLPYGMQGPVMLKAGITLPRWSVLPDFNQARYNKAVREGRLDEFLANQQYNRDMHDAIMYAKGGDPFADFSPARWFSYLRKHPEFGAKYYGSEKKLADAIFYVDGMKAAVRYAKANGKFDPARFVAYLKNHPKLREAYFDRHKGKREEWARNDAYIKYISVWGKLAGAGKWDQANAAWKALPQWVKDRYYENNPGKRRQAQQTAEYLGYMQRWIKYFDDGDKVGAMKYFRNLPNWVKERYYAKHPDKRAKYELTTKMADLVSSYFATDKANQQRLLEENPALRKWLAQNASGDQQKKWAILAAYQSIPSSEAWLRKVFREKYPEIFSPEAKGEAILRSVYASLKAHPQMTPGFEKWVKAIWASYEEMLRKGAARPLSSYFEVDRKVPARLYRKSLSAEESSR